MKRRPQDSRANRRQSSKDGAEKLAAVGREGAVAAAGAFERLAARIRDDAASLTLPDFQAQGVVVPRNARAFGPPMNFKVPDASKKAVPLTTREERIYSAIQMGLKGLAYSRELDRQKLRPPRAWIERGCPASYPAAYRDKAWRAKIQEEKSYITRKARTTGIQ